MARSDKGQVINAFLERGMPPDLREDFEAETEHTSMKDRLMEKRRDAR